MSIESVTADQSGHTPGPWGIVPRKPVEVRLKRDHWEVGSLVTRRGIAYAFGDTDADARLIAAAPDLLAALRDALPALEYLAESTLDDGPLNTCCEELCGNRVCSAVGCVGMKVGLARMALEKARG